MTPRKGYYKDLTGKKYGLWTVLSFHHKDVGKHSSWLCKCACGTIRVVRQPNLVGEGGSCGCNCSNWMTPLRKGWIKDGIGYLPLTKGMVALVSPHRLEELQQWHWFVSRSKNGEFYVNRWATDEGGKRYQQQLGRFILKMSRFDEREADHINMNPLDNQDHNLRALPRIHHMCNRKVRRDSQTGAKGVHFNKTNGTYYVNIRFEGVRTYLGRSKSLEEAKRLYAEGSARLHGEFGRVE